MPPRLSKVDKKKDNTTKTQEHKNPVSQPPTTEIETKVCPKTDTSMETTSGYFTPQSDKTKRLHLEMDPNSPSPQKLEMDRSRLLLDIKQAVTGVVKEEMKSGIDEIKKQIDSVTVQLGSLQNEHDQHKTTTTKKIQLLENKLEFETEKNRTLEDRLNKLEQSSRKNNLKFINIQESPRENPHQTELNVFNALQKVNIKLPPISIVSANRVGRPNKTYPRAIIVTFHHLKDKSLILSHASAMYKQSKIRVEEDLTETISNRRKQILPILKTAKYNHHKASMVADKLLLDGKLYSTENLHKLPSHLQPQNATTFTNSDTVVFFTHLSPFSNHHLCNFVYNDTKFSSSEQAYMLSKAECAEDQELSTEIMKTNEPSKQKGLSYHIKNLDENKWNAIKYEKMEQIVSAKFAQNQHLQDILVNTDNRTLVEGNPKDPYWGAGLSIYDEQIWDDTKRPGQNYLGRILMNIRESYK